MEQTEEKFLLGIDRAKLESIYRGSPFPSYISWAEVKIYWQGEEILLSTEEAHEFFGKIYSRYFQLLKENCENLTERLSDFMAELSHCVVNESMNLCNNSTAINLESKSES